MIFEDRIDAATQLARALAKYRGKNPLVLAIPRGAVPMGRLVAAELEGELDVVLVRKLGAPGNPEFAGGAVDEAGWTYLAPWAPEVGGYYLAELIMAGETMKEGMKVLEPYLKKSAARRAGICGIGTVKGDLHDIGKNVFVSLLRAQNYEVMDLGVDVSAKGFVEAVKGNKPDLVAMSALLTTTMGEMEKVVQELKTQGLRDGLKIIIGGAPLTQEYAKKIGADAAAHDAVEGIRIISQW